MLSGTSVLPTLGGEQSRQVFKHVGHQAFFQRSPALSRAGFPQSVLAVKRQTSLVRMSDCPDFHDTGQWWDEGECPMSWVNSKIEGNTNSSIKACGTPGPFPDDGLVQFPGRLNRYPSMSHNIQLMSDPTQPITLPRRQ